MTSTPILATYKDEEQDKKEELKNNLLGYIGGTGLEVGAGYGTDLATAGLLNPATIAATGGWSIAGYAATNFASGAASNWAAQKLRGEEEISWGEIISSGLIDIIPFFGQKAKGVKGVTRAFGVDRAVKNVGGTAIEAGARTVAQRQGEVSIDEQRWLTPRETLEAAALGGAFGTAFRGTGEGYNYWKSKYKKYDLQEADKLFPPEAVQELVKQGRIRYKGEPVDKNFQAVLFSSIDGKSPISGASNEEYLNYLRGRQRMEAADQTYNRELTRFSRLEAADQLSTQERSKFQRLKASYSTFADTKEIALRHGDTEFEAWKFLDSERRYEDNLERAKTFLNHQYDVRYKQMVEDKIDEMIRAKAITPQMGRDILRLADELSKNPQTIQSVGHTEALKNILEKGERAGNRSSNIDLEMMIDFFTYDNDGNISKLYKGNRSRGDRSDLPPLTRRLLQGQTTDLEEEYLFKMKPELFTRKAFDEEGNLIDEVVPTNWQGTAVRQYLDIMDEARAYLRQNPNSDLTLDKVSNAITVTLRDFYSKNAKYFDKLKDRYSDVVVYRNTKADKTLAKALEKSLKQLLENLGINPIY